MPISNRDVSKRNEYYRRLLGETSSTNPLPAEVTETKGQSSDLVKELLIRFENNITDDALYGKWDEMRSLIDRIASSFPEQERAKIKNTTLEWAFNGGTVPAEIRSRLGPQHEEPMLLKYASDIKSGLYKDLEKQNTGFNLDNLSGIFAGSPSKEQVNFVAANFSDKMRDEFVKQVGREPTKGELQSIFNTTNFQAKLPNMSKIDLNSYLDNTDLIFSTSLGGTPYEISNTVTRLKPKFDIVTSAQEELGRYGGNLSDSQIAQITSDITDVDTSQVLASQFVKTVAEGKVSEAIPRLAGEQQTAIGELETQLGEAGSKFFKQQQPFIERNLAARGLLRSGSLPEAISRQLGQLATGREATIAPLRYQATADSFKNQLQNTLRGALESGQSLESAMNFARNQLATTRQNAYSTYLTGLKNQYSNQLFDKQTALQLALADRGDEGGAWDDFLQYGLPVLGQLGGGFLRGFGSTLGSKKG